MVSRLISHLTRKMEITGTEITPPATINTPELPTIGIPVVNVNEKWPKMPDVQIPAKNEFDRPIPCTNIGGVPTGSDPEIFK